MRTTRRHAGAQLHMFATVSVQRRSDPQSWAPYEAAAFLPRHRGRSSYCAGRAATANPMDCTCVRCSNLSTAWSLFGCGAYPPRLATDPIRAVQPPILSSPKPATKDIVVERKPSCGRFRRQWRDKSQSALTAIFFTSLRGHLLCPGGQPSFRRPCRILGGCLHHKSDPAPKAQHEKHQLHDVPQQRAPTSRLKASTHIIDSVPRARH